MRPAALPPAVRAAAFRRAVRAAAFRRAVRAAALRPTRTALAAAALALALLPAACGRRAAPTQPAGTLSLPPGITAVSPPPRGTAVPYDSLDIWAEFAEPLDSTSVSATTVFLKIDTQRLPIRVAWDSARRRIVVTTTTTILLQQTYTVVLSPNLRSADGVPFGRTWSWQFTVNSVRRAHGGYPNGQVESPYASLSWIGNSANDGPAFYDVYAGTDSAAVAARRAPRIYSGTATRIPPQGRWAQPGPVYWAVNTVSASTHETLPGPVWSFTTDPPDTPVDSLDVPLDFSAYSSGTYGSVCLGPSIIVGPGYNAGLSWNMNGVPTALHLDRAVMTVSALPGFESWLASSSTTLWYATAAWTCTRTSLTGAPYTDEVRGKVASARLDVPGTARFESDTLTAYLEYTIRNNGPRGFIPRSDRLIYLASQTDPARKPTLEIYYYRRTAAATLGAGR